jgi:hypothetical protein
MMTTKRSLAKLLGPALLLTATLSVPAVSTAAPSPKDNKAHAADKWEKKDKQKDQREQAKLHAKQQREQAKLHAKQQREAAKLQNERQREAARRQAESVRVDRRPVYREPAYQPAQNRNRRRYDWDGWNRGRGTGFFRLEGNLFDQRQGCQLVREHGGQVIPLVGNSDGLERGDHVQLYGRVENNTVCGTAFRVYEVERIWADGGHRNVIFDRNRDGDFDNYHDRSAWENRGRNRQYDRDRYDDRYDGRYDDRYDDEYNGNRRLISVDGRLGGSSRCPSLRTNDGEVFGLEGDLEGRRPGDNVRVIGFFENSRSSCGFNRTIVFDEING